MDSAGGLNKSMDDIDLGETREAEQVGVLLNSSRQYNPPMLSTSSLSSIVNKPIKKSFIKQLTNISFLKNKANKNASGKYVYKEQKESEVTDSLHIPKVVWPRDFQQKLNSRQHVEAEYLFTQQVLNSQDKEEKKDESSLSPSLLARYTTEFSIKKYTRVLNKQRLTEQSSIAQQHENLILHSLNFRISD